MKNHKIVQYSALDHTFNCLLLQLRGYKLFYFYFLNFSLNARISHEKS